MSTVRWFFSLPYIAYDVWRDFHKHPEFRGPNFTWHWAGEYAFQVWKSCKPVPHSGKGERR